MKLMPTSEIYIYFFNREEERSTLTGYTFYFYSVHSEEKLLLLFFSIWKRKHGEILLQNEKERFKLLLLLLSYCLL